MKVIVAVDGSDCSTQAVEFLSNRLWAKEDQFLVLTVVEPIPAEFGIGYLPPQGAMADRFYEESAEVSGKAAASLQKALPENLVEVKVVDGLVAETICNCAEELDADLIVIGSHGRKGAAHFFLGSVAEEVLKRSPCSVEIIKIKKSVREAHIREEKKAKRAVKRES